LSTKTKILIACGPVACLLSTLAVFIEGATRADYNSFRYPLSSLAIGESGWTQISNFIITGSLLFLFSVGLKKIFNSTNEKFRGPLLIRLVAIGLIGAGICYTDPVYGYPPDKPLLLAQFTLRGHLHDGFSMLVFICLPAACFVFRKRFIAAGKKAWARYSVFTGFAIIVTFIFTSMGFKQVAPFVDFAGLLQRLCIAFGWAWIMLFSFHLLKIKK
jgi:hypothetical protein